MNCVVCPLSSEVGDPLTDTLVTGCSTVTAHVATSSPAASFTVAVPVPFAVILPYASTVTTLASLDFHATSPVKFIGWMSETSA